VDGVTRISLSLPSNLVSTLDLIARERGVDRGEILRDVIGEYVRRIEGDQIEREMQEYVDALGPYSGEFVAETDAHVTERLLRDTEW
jgi:metal-responsive CopG/Arc/MetJ family transcriptional regulator